MGLVDFSENELNILLKNCTDSESLKMQKTVNDDILEIVKIFSKQGHSGFSAKYTINLLNRLLNYKPLSPITDSENEWELIDETIGSSYKYQCKRCPQLFMDDNKKVFDIEAQIFTEDNGHTWFTSNESVKEVTLPYEVPNSPKYVVKDTGKERDTIRLSILTLCVGLNNEPIHNSDEITEDTPIVEILSADKLSELYKQLDFVYKFNENKFEILKDDCIWQIINKIISNKTNVIEE